jgi:hypothetical protein
MRTASDPLRASHKRIAELRNLGNVDLDRLGRLVDPVVDRFLARDVDAVFALDFGSTNGAFTRDLESRGACETEQQDDRRPQREGGQQERPLDVLGYRIAARLGRRGRD